MKKQFTILILIISFVSSIFLFPVLAKGVSNVTQLSNQIIGQIEAGAKTGGLGEPVAPQMMFVNVIKIALGLFGSVFLALIVYGGFLYINSRGEEETAKKAQKIITGAIIGLAIVLLSYSITLFVGTKTTDNDVIIETSITE